MRKLLILSIGLGLMACVTSKMIITGNTYSPYGGIVKVYQSPPEDVEYEEIGWVSVEGDLGPQWVDMIQSMQVEAAKKGANAIILSATKQTQEVRPAIGLYAGSSSQKSMIAIAIRIKE